ncbi:TonB-dependent receptor plug domain-containing protein, partial [Acinetobacter baumannii]
FSINGQTLRGRNLAVLIDGIPQSTTINVRRDLFNIDASAIERIEVLRGPTAIYGDGATGGVINITRAPGEGPVRFTT